jgi:hypothetical protein
MIRNLRIWLRHSFRRPALNAEVLRSLQVMYMFANRSFPDADADVILPRMRELLVVFSSQLFVGYGAVSYDFNIVLQAIWVDYMSLIGPHCMLTSVHRHRILALAVWR